MTSNGGCPPRLEAPRTSPPARGASGGRARWSGQRAGEALSRGKFRAARRASTEIFFGAPLLLYIAADTVVKTDLLDPTFCRKDLYFFSGVREFFRRKIPGGRTLGAAHPRRSYSPPAKWGPGRSWSPRFGFFAFLHSTGTPLRDQLVGCGASASHPRGRPASPRLLQLYPVLSRAPRGGRTSTRYCQTLPPGLVLPWLGASALSLAVLPATLAQPNPQSSWRTRPGHGSPAVATSGPWQQICAGSPVGHARGVRAASACAAGTSRDQRMGQAVPGCPEGGRPGWSSSVSGPLERGLEGPASPLYPARTRGGGAGATTGQGATAPTFSEPGPTTSRPPSGPGWHARWLRLGGGPVAPPGRRSPGLNGGERTPAQPGGHHNAMVVDLPGGCATMQPNPETLRLAGRWLGSSSGAWDHPARASGRRARGGPPLCEDEVLTQRAGSLAEKLAEHLSGSGPVQNNGLFPGDGGGAGRPSIEDSNGPMVPRIQRQ